jgi:hypothetical protein
VSKTTGPQCFRNSVIIWSGPGLILVFKDIIRVIKSRRMRLERYVACMEETRLAHKILVFRPDMTRPLGRSRYRWESNIGMDLKEGGWEGVGRIHLD